MTGFSIEELSAGNRRNLLNKSMLGSLCFITGFSIIFILLGFSASFAGSLVFEFQNYLRIIGGLMIMFFGLTLAGILRIRSLEIDRRFSMKNMPVGYAGAVIMGMTFVAGWVPCVGPILSSILTIASTSGSRSFGGLLLFSYCLGLGLPIFISAVAFNYFLVIYRKTVKHLKLISIISGAVLILIGLLLMTDNLSSLSDYLTYLLMFKGAR
jgi:cytochrome c-type biogenesis protein